MLKLRFTRMLTVGLVLFLGVSMTFAQQDRQRGQGGRGGRGGGGFGPQGVLGLINNEAVQKELGVDKDTTDKLKKVSDDARADLRPPEGQGGFGAFQGLSDDERRAKMDELRKAGEERQAKVNAKYIPQVQEILNDGQYTRLKEIYWQSNLQAALADAEVVKAVDLTKEQQEKVAAVTKEYRDKQAELFRGGRGNGGGGGGGNFQEAFAKMQEMSKERDTKTLDVLSAEQKEKFTKLKGKEFDVAQLRGGGGRGGRGRGGRPGGDNNNN